jgi:hypothetical protein
MVTGNGTASSALALSKRRGQRAHRPHHHTAVIRCFMVPRAKFIKDFSPTYRQTVEKTEIDLELLDRSCLDGSVSVWAETA